MYIAIGCRAVRKLGALRRSTCTPEQLQENFARADLDGEGSLTLNQFRVLTSSSGLDLNRRESEAAFMQIDRSQTGRLTYESIQMWWTMDASEHDTFVPAAILLE
mmetsp:Transcript_19525/g.35436  ORF Transcript_19525/g.35436 Transcript_19525/m.35436 type:complete len:105 (+) Transcript_19525:822-1136(+)